MPVSHRWDNDDQTIYAFFMDGQWTWKAYQEALRLGYETIAAVGYSVDLIYAFMSPLPPGDAVYYLTLTSEAQPQNCRHTVMVNPSGDVIERIISVVDSMRQWEGPAFFDSLEEARAYLAALNASGAEGTDI